MTAPILSTKDFFRFLEPVLSAINKNARGDAPETLERLLRDPKEFARASSLDVDPKVLERYDEIRTNKNLGGHREILERLAKGGLFHENTEEWQIPFVKTYLNIFTIVIERGGAGALFLLASLFDVYELQRLDLDDSRFESFWLKNQPSKEHWKQMKEELKKWDIVDCLDKAQVPGDDPKPKRSICQTLLNIITGR
ncbi:uncharacterized protein KY384_003067 [Bacidia gigantensis]|uniref:uncharacterized protein n=1 Tax=Bacidia gigantensis TaxID=2732470 RepID=UPI001D035FF2|nr:uncharacterized protein KY384_003067 [Bacidia gigantensis]KAG8531438.1 hypothetical protein KY384_003067 [Bacidia gigantensis]